MNVRTNDNSSPLVPGKHPCGACGSSDALSYREDGSSRCFACDTSFPAAGSDTITPLHPTSQVDRVIDKEFKQVAFQDLPKRKLTETTCKKYSYGVAGSDQVAQYLDRSGKVVAQKFRTRDKSFPWKNRAAFRGLYGNWLFRDGGKMVVITEGELDALSVSQAFGNKWPAVSLPDGASSAEKAIKEDLEWLSTFDKVVLFFDNDDPGVEAADKIKKILPPGKCYIAFAPDGYKDASDMLQANATARMLDVIYGAKQYRPDGLVSGEGLFERLLDRPHVDSIPFPDFLPDLNHKTGGGMRFGELDTWTSGTGMGKTTVIKALQHHIWSSTQYNQALIHLEEPLVDTADDLIAYDLGIRFQLEPDVAGFRESDTYRDTAKKLFLGKDNNGHNRFQIYDAFGSFDDDNDLYSIIRHAVVVDNCKFVWLDHLSILVSDGDAGDDERRRIDRIMHQLKALTVELNIYIGLISHLRKPPGNGRSFENGATPTLDDLRGSGGIKQLSNGVFAISRDQQAENVEARQTSHIHVLKCRRTGRTGPADYILYDDKTGLLSPTSMSDFETHDNNGDY